MTNIAQDTTSIHAEKNKVDDIKVGRFSSTSKPIRFVKMQW